MNYHYRFFKANICLAIIITVCFNLNNVSGQTLKELAAQKGKFIGTAVTDEFINNNQAHGANYYRIAGEQFNAVVAENAFKMESILSKKPANPFNIQQSDLRLDLVDRFIGYAQANRMITRGHVLIWYGQAPGWLSTDAKNWTSQQVTDFSTSYIKAIVGYCKGKVKEWDVVNEAFTDGNASTYRSGTWFDKVNSKQAFFDACFNAARTADPSAKLYITDYDIEVYNADPKSKNGFMRSVAKSMKDRGVAIDGVGFQTHYTSGFDSNLAANIGVSIDKLKESNLLVSITEMDIRICGKDQNQITRADYDIQAKNYQDIAREALSRSNCTTMIIWGFTDALSWIPGWFVTDKCNDALIYDRNYQIKPSYTAVQTAIKNLGGVTTSGIVMRAKGTIGGEKIDIKVNGAIVKSVTLTTANVDYTATFGSGTVSVSFADNVGDAIIDYVSINGKVYQSENQTSNTGVYQNGRCGGSNSEYMHCAGTITYSTPSARNSNDEETINNKLSEINVFPNPASDVISIDGLLAGKVKVSLLTIMGGTVKVNEFVSTHDQFTFNVNDVAKGIYLLEISQSDNTITKKIVIE